MAGLITQEMQARGVAQVMVILKNPPEAGRTASLRAGTTAAARVSSGLGRLSRHFRSSELSQTSALMTAARSGRSVSASRRLGVSHRKTRASRPPEARYYPNLGIMLGTVDHQGLAALRADPRVEAVCGTPQMRLIRPRTKADATLTRRIAWGIEAMGIPALWKKGLNGKGVLVGHLDTGADGKHPALKKAIARFAEFDDLGQEVLPAPRPFDTDDHGTHTAATIAGRPVRGRCIGVAPGSRLASAIVIEGGNGVARVLGGMDWAVGHGVRILSMSLGFQGWVDDFLALTRLLRARNILPVFAVGNEGPGTSRSPGNYPETLSVGAHDPDDQVAEFSSSQRFSRKRDPVVPDLLAPGVDVVSARPGGGYQSMDGTSMATPHIAGLAALLMQAKPTAKAAEVEHAIFESCKRPPGMDPERGNRGVPDAKRALGLL
jgi:subtilisin